MGAPNIPAWHYSRLSDLAYRDRATLQLGRDLPPGWRYVNTIPGETPGTNVLVSVFVNDAQRVVVGAERGTVRSQIVPDMIPNNTTIAFGEKPRGANDTERILRDLGSNSTYRNYDIVGAGDSEGGANSAVGISRIRDLSSPNVTSDRDRYYAITINAPHSPHVANDSNIINIRLGGDPVSSQVLGPAPSLEVTLWNGAGESIDSTLASPTSLSPLWLVPINPILIPVGIGTQYAPKVAGFVGGLPIHDVTLATDSLRQPGFATLTPWGLYASHQADPAGFRLMSNAVVSRVRAEHALYKGLSSDIEERIKPVGEVTINPNYTEPAKDTRTAEQRIISGESPDGKPLNLWHGGEDGGARYIWIRGADNSLIQIVDARNGYIFENHYSSSNGQLEFQRYFDPNTQEFKVAYDKSGIGLQQGLGNQLHTEAQDLYINGIPQASTSPTTPLRVDEAAPGPSLDRGPHQPRVDENGMPLPEIREGARYDAGTDPVYAAFLNAFRDAQQSDHSLPAGSYQLADSGAIRSDASPGYGATSASSPGGAGAARLYFLSDTEITAHAFLGYGRPGSVPDDPQGIQRDAYDWLTGTRHNANPWVEDTTLVFDAERTVRTYTPGLSGSIADPSVSVLPNGNAPVPEVQLRVFVDHATNRVVMNAQGSVFPNIPGSSTLSNWMSDLQNSGASEYVKFEPLADAVYSRVQANYPGYEVTIVGHSLAGGHAQTFAIRNNISCGTLDSLPIPVDSITRLYGGPDAFRTALTTWQQSGNTCNSVFTEGEIADAYYRQVRGEFYLDRAPTVLPSGVSGTAAAVRYGLEGMSDALPYLMTPYGAARFGEALGTALPATVQGGILHASGQAWMRVRDLPTDEHGRAVLDPEMTSLANREIDEYGVTMSIVRDRISPVGQVNINTEPPAPGDFRTPAQRVLDGEAPNGDPVNQWLGHGSAQYMWLPREDGLIQVVNAGNGFIFESRFSSVTGEIEFSRYFDPGQGRMIVNFDQRPMINADLTSDSYVIQRGDTLSALARRHDVPLSDILDANPGLALNPDRIFAGQRINIPGLGGGRQPAGAEDSYLLQSGPSTNASFESGERAYLSGEASLDPVAGAGSATDPFLSMPKAGPPLASNFGNGLNTDPFGPPGYSFLQRAEEPAWYSGKNLDANSYAQGMQSAVSLIQALQQGNEFSALVSGASMLSAFARASGAAAPFSPTVTPGLGALSAGLNLYDALKADDNFGALLAGSNMSVQVAHWVAANAAFEGATRSAAGSFAESMGPVVGALSIANSLRQGDELGAAIGAIMMVNPVLGIGLSIARALFGGDDPPEPRGTAEVQWNSDGTLRVAVTEDDDGGGKSAEGMMQSMLDTLNDFLGQHTDAHGDPQYALIPQRLPTVSFFQREYAEFKLNFTDELGQRITRHYNGQGQRLGLDGSVESSFVEDFLNQALSSNALVPKWEADTIRQRMEHGDAEAWKTETLSAPDETADAPSLARGPRLDPIGDVKAGLMVLTFHLQGPVDDLEREDSAPNSAFARFDLNGDSYLDPVDWTAPYQAFLALDRDGNGLIDSGRELITTHANATHRIASLEWLDANHDGVIDRQDPAFTALKLWLDVNANAQTNDGELASLAELGITAIDFTQGTPRLIDADGAAHPLTPKHLQPKGEGARIAQDAGGTQIELQDGYKAMYLRVGDARIQSAPPSQSVQQELARHTSIMSREAQGMFGSHAALLTGLAVAQTAAAGTVPASPLTLNEAEHAIAAAQRARSLASDPRFLAEGSGPVTPATPGGAVPDRASASGTIETSRVHSENSETATPYLAPNPQEGTPEYPDVAPGGDAPVFTNPLTTGEIIAGSEDTALILTQAALLTNDFSRNQGAQLRISAVGNAVNGSVALLDTGEVVFTPALNYFGPASFSYTVTDQWGYASQALATVNLASVNDAPVIEAVEFGRPIFGYQYVTVRNYSVDWQPGWAYDYGTGQYYQDVQSLQAVNSDTTALSLLATNNLRDAGGNPLTPNYYQSGQLRPIAFDSIDATQVTYDDNGNPVYTRLDDPTRQQGRVIAYDIDGDSGLITYGLGGNPAHGHASVGWMASASAEPWPSVEPGQLSSYAQTLYGAWQYASHPGDGYNGSDPFQVAVTDGEGGVTLATVNAWHHGTSQGGGGKKPVALDLDGNGLDFVGLDDSNVYFDVNGDGWREHIAWTGANDGLLVLDTEGDRVIDKPEEISFARYLVGAVTDLEGLRAFDENSDGLLDRLDARFGDFAVWQDANQNGLSEEGEVRSLEEMGIASINLASDQVTQTLANGDVTLFGTGTYTTTDGQTRVLGDAMFRYTNETQPPADAAEIMRQALVFTEMSAGFTAAVPSMEPLAGLDATVPDPTLIAYEDPTGLTAGGKT